MTGDEGIMTGGAPGEGQSEVMNSIAARLSGASAVEKFLKKAGRQIILPSVARNIGLGGRPPFAPLAPSTLAAKKRKGQPLMPLVATGKLLKSLMPGAPGNVFLIDAEAGTGEYGTSVPYARYHQRGTRRMPARPFVLLQEEDVYALQLLAAQSVLGTLSVADPR